MEGCSSAVQKREKNHDTISKGWEAVVRFFALFCFLPEKVGRVPVPR